MQKRDRKDFLAKKAYRLGFDNEKKYGVCSQCTLMAIMQTLDGCSDPALIQAVFGFLGGAGDSTRAMCGGLAAGIMAISQRHGRPLEAIDDEGTPDLTCSTMVRQLMGRFEAEYGSFICADIQTRLMGKAFNFSDPGDWEPFLAAGGHEIHCPHVVGSAAKWTVEILLDADKE